MSEFQKHALEDSGTGYPSNDCPEDATRFVLVGGSFRRASGDSCDASSYIVRCYRLRLVFEWSTIRISLAESESCAIYQDAPSLRPWPNHRLMHSCGAVNGRNGDAFLVLYAKEIDTALCPFISQATCSQ
jgi:hypothetical protein